MNKPYIVCHMMTSVDGRIDCAMTEHLPGVQEYYDTLDALDAPTRISGRVTAELEMALPGKFEAKTAEALGKGAFSKAADAEGYEIVVDTHGTLLWGESAEDERPLLILTNEQVSKEYLAYLNGKHISWIACGKEHVDLKRACEILAAEFDVKRAAAVGGGHINAGFLAAGLLDEVSILIGAGIDGINPGFNLDKINYHKVIILSDADQDGMHIRCILLTFFFRYMRDLVNAGHVYIGMPPLYKVYKGDKVEYAYDDKELAEKIAKVGKGYQLQRYKGLGEMSADQLWDTTMNPATRNLTQVTIEDAAKAERMITTLMGDKVEGRKEFLAKYANFNKHDEFMDKIDGKEGAING